MKYMILKYICVSLFALSFLCAGLTACGFQDRFYLNIDCTVVSTDRIAADIQIKCDSDISVDILVGMIALTFDPEQISVDPDSLEIFEGQILAVDNSQKEGHFSAQWMHLDGISITNAEQTLMHIEFTLTEGADFAAAMSSIGLCKSKEYLDSIGQYGEFGGVILLTEDFKYCVNNNTVIVSVDIQSEM